MDAEINNVIYMELNSGPKIANSTCGQTIDVETIDRDSTVIEIFRSLKSVLPDFKDLNIVILFFSIVYGKDS